MENKIIQEDYEGIVFSVEFISGRPLKRSHKGKHWPLTTQCIIRKNNLIISIGEVTKHENEKENPFFARVKSAKKAFNQLDGMQVWREMRERIWKQILEN